MRSPIGRRRVLRRAMDRGVSARSACRLLGFSRSVACYGLRQPVKDEPLVAQLVQTSQQYPRFGYRRMAFWLSWSQKRVRRMWSRLGLQLPRRRRRNAAWAPTCGCSVPSVSTSVWTYDFVHDRLADKPPSAALRARRAHAGMPGDRSSPLDDLDHRGPHARPADATARQAGPHPL